MTITKNHVVTLNYKLHTVEENGEKVFVEETTNENPLTFLHGAGMMIPKFEENIDGLTKGDKKSFILTPENAYGEKDPNALAQLPLDMFNESGVPPVGAVLPLADNNGNQFRANPLPNVVLVTPTQRHSQPNAAKQLLKKLESDRIW